MQVTKTVGHPTPILTDDAVIAPSKMSRISWGAVIAGVVIAIIIQVTMNILGLAIGAGIVDPTATQPTIGPAFSTGVVIWLASSTLLGIFAGAYVTAHLAGTPDTTDGIIHGLLTWAVGTVIVVLMLGSTASNVFNGISSTLGQGMSLVGASITEVAPEVADALNLQASTLATIQDEIGSLPTEEGTSISIELPIAIIELLRQDSQSENADETRQAVVTLMAEQTTLTEAEVEAQLQQWEAQSRTLIAQADETARQAADDLANAIAATAGVLFSILVVGAFAGGAGGYVGTPQRIMAVDVQH